MNKQRKVIRFKNDVCPGCGSRDIEPGDPGYDDYCLNCHYPYNKPKLSDRYIPGSSDHIEY